MGKGEKAEIKRVIFFGAGDIGRQAMLNAKEANYDVVCFIDNDSLKWGGEIDGVKVFSPEYLNEFCDDVEILVTVAPNTNYENGIILQLKELGFEDNVRRFADNDSFNADVLLKSRFVKFHPITKGLDSAKKYYCENEKGERFFTLIVPFFRCKHLQMQYTMMKKAAQEGVLMPKPIEFGGHDCGGYIIYDWVDGDILHDILPTMTKKEQYAHGITAGAMLKKIHSVPVGGTPDEFKKCFFNELETRLRIYPECYLKMTDVERRLLEYVLANKHLVKTAPFVFSHQDYSPWNMFMCNGELVIFDFNECKYGVVWEDLGRAVLISSQNTSFASGILYGYFGKKIEREIWEMITFYGALRLMSWFVSYAYSYPNSLDHVKSLNTAFLNNYDDLRNPIPKWYN